MAATLVVFDDNRLARHMPSTARSQVRHGATTLANAGAICALRCTELRPIELIVVLGLASYITSVPEHVLATPWPQSTSPSGHPPSTRTRLDTLACLPALFNTYCTVYVDPGIEVSTPQYTCRGQKAQKATRSLMLLVADPDATRAKPGLAHFELCTYCACSPFPGHL